jgi:hypothetical protein
MSAVECAVAFIAVKRAVALTEAVEGPFDGVVAAVSPHADSFKAMNFVVVLLVVGCAVCRVTCEYAFLVVTHESAVPLVVAVEVSLTEVLIQ